MSTRFHQDSSWTVVGRWADRTELNEGELNRKLVKERAMSPIRSSEYAFVSTLRSAITYSNSAGWIRSFLDAMLTSSES